MPKPDGQRVGNVRMSVRLGMVDEIDTHRGRFGCQIIDPSKHHSNGGSELMALFMTCRRLLHWSIQHKGCVGVPE